MSSSINSFLMKCNLFYSNYKVRFNNQIRLESNLGLFFTICLLGLCLSLIITNGSNLINRKKLNINMNTLTFEKQELFNITEKTLMFSYYIDFPREVLLNESIMTVEIGNFKVQKGNDDGMYTSIYFIPLEWEFCGDNFDYHLSKYNYYQNNTSYLNTNSFLNHLCVKNLSSIEMGGQFTSDYFSNIYMKIIKCIPSKAAQKNITCVEENEMENIFKGKFFNLFITDAYFDTTDFSSPIKHKITNYYNLLDLKIKNFEEVFMQHTYIETDVGIIFEENLHREIINVDKFSSLTGSVNPNDGSIFEFYINSSTNRTIISRSYMKFQELAAFIGGFIKIYMIIAEIICNYFYNKMELFDMINSFYHVDLESESNSKNMFLNDLFTKSNINTPKLVNSLNNNKIEVKMNNFMTAKTTSENNSHKDNSFSKQNILIKSQKKLVKVNKSEKVIGKLKFSYFKVFQLDLLFCMKSRHYLSNGINTLQKELEKNIDLSNQVKNNILVNRLCDVFLSTDQSTAIKSNLYFEHKFNISSNNSNNSDNISKDQINLSISKLQETGGDLNNKILNLLGFVNKC